MTLPSNEKISDNFFYSELVDSQTAQRLGIDNTPDLAIYKIAIKTAFKMEEVRKLLRDVPITVSSWYRSTTLNAKIGGSVESQHCKGEAVDFTARRYGTPQEICVQLSRHADTLQFDQLIFEHSWVHISFNFTAKRLPRKQVLTLLATGKYASGITDKKGNPLWTE